MDEELVKLSIVDQLQRLGLAQHFVEEIDRILSVVHRWKLIKDGQKYVSIHWYENNEISVIKETRIFHKIIVF